MLKSARVATVGDRVDVAFDGLRMGIFEGSFHLRFFPRQPVSTAVRGDDNK